MQISLRKQTCGKSYGLVPDYFADSIADVDFQELQRAGVRYIALDVDQTLTHHNAIELTGNVAAILNAQLSAGTVQKIFIASNSRRDLTAIAGGIQAQVVRASRRVRKPTRAYYQRLLRTAGCRPHEIAMIGDRLFTDVLGGNRAGMVTVLVQPDGPDILFDRLIRRRYWGKRYLKRQR